MDGKPSNLKIISIKSKSANVSRRTIRQNGIVVSDDKYYELTIRYSSDDLHSALEVLHKALEFREKSDEELKVHLIQEYDKQIISDAKKWYGEMRQSCE